MLQPWHPVLKEQLTFSFFMNVTLSNFIRKHSLIQIFLHSGFLLFSSLSQSSRNLENLNIVSLTIKNITWKRQNSIRDRNLPNKVKTEKIFLKFGKWGVHFTLMGNFIVEIDSFCSPETDCALPQYKLKLC